MAISIPVYATREDIKDALDSKETARNNTRIDDELMASTLSVESQMHRKFYPQTATRYFPWPDRRSPTPSRLWLDDDELISLSSLSSGGTTIAATDYFLEPVNTGPPYTSIQIDLDSSAAFGGGSTWQRGITGVGVFGHSNNTAPAGALAEALDTSETGVDVTDSALIGIGSLIKVDSERMLVTGKASLTTGQTVITSALTASATNETVLVTSAASMIVGEMLTIDSERMLVVDITGNSLTVKRAWDGSTLAAHNTGVTIYAGRTLTVVRGACGTTAAAHDTAAAITVQVYPGLIRELCKAETVALLTGQARAWARGSGAAESEKPPVGTGLAGLRADAARAYRRKARMAAV